MNSVLRTPRESVPMSVLDNERIKIFDWIESLIFYSISFRSFSMSFSAMTSCSDNEELWASLQMDVPIDNITCSHGFSAEAVFCALSFSFFCRFS